jgi:hypothetical protein
MKTNQNFAKWIAGAVLCAATSAGAATYTIQSAGSDAASLYFQQNALPGIQAMIAAKLPESSPLGNLPKMYPLDPATLQISTTKPLRAYFLSEGADYKNTMGFNATGVGTSSGNPQTYIANASAPPLHAGDFVDLGTMPVGSVMDFYVIANGYNGGKNVFTTVASANPDKLAHVIGLNYAVNAYQSDSGYLILGFEDLLNGGDKDYNDVMIAIEGLAVATPEPALWLTLGTFGMLGLLARRRKQA